MLKKSTCIILCLVLLRTGATPANPDFTRDTAATSRTVGHSSDYFALSNADYTSVLGTIARAAQETHAAFELLTVATGETRVQWLASNALALSTIAQFWPPSQENCRTACGEAVGDYQYGLFRTGTCQVHILEEHRKFFGTLALEAAGYAGMESLAWKPVWYGDPIASWPPYWTFTHAPNAPPIYMMNGYCACRPGWGMSQDLEDDLWSGNSPFNGPVITEPSNPWTTGVYQTVNYTGQGRVIMSTLMTHDNFQDYADAESTNVVLGFKAPMACEIEIDQPLRHSSKQSEPVDVRHTYLKPSKLMSDAADTCADEHDKGHGVVNDVALACMMKLWGNEPMSVDFPADGISTDIIILAGFQITPTSSSPSLQACLPYYADLNTQGWCDCHAGFGDSDHVWKSYQEDWLLERPYEPASRVTSASEQSVVTATLYAPSQGCNGFNKFYCALSDPKSFPDLPTVTGARLGSPRCDDFRACNLVGIKNNYDRHKVVPYRLKAATRGYLQGQDNRAHLPSSWTPDEAIEVYNENKALLFLGHKQIRVRTCHSYVCTSVSHDGAGPTCNENNECACACTSPWTGQWCEVDGDAVYCSNHGSYTTATGLCDCDDDWFHTTPGVANATQCNVRCGELLCNSNGVCSQDVTSCTCDPYHDGSDCSALCGATHCNGHGNCTSPWVEGVSACFDCDAGFSGTHCEVNPRWQRCSGHGDPVDTAAPGYAQYEDGCLCDEQYYGADCSLFINPDDSTCTNELGDSEYDSTYDTKIRTSYGARRVLDHYPAFGQDDEV